MIRAVVVFGVLAACGPDPVRARVERAGATVVDVEVELATTADERARGLRGHAPLGDGEGLVIELPQALEVCIVNDGVDFAIDAVYAGDGGDVVALEPAIAAGDATARCHDGVARVLEVAAGVASEVAIGDVLVVE